MTARAARTTTLAGPNRLVLAVATGGLVALASGGTALLVLTGTSAVAPQTALVPPLPTSRPLAGAPGVVVLPSPPNTTASGSRSVGAQSPVRRTPAAAPIPQLLAAPPALVPALTALPFALPFVPTDTPTATPAVDASGAPTKAELRALRAATKRAERAARKAGDGTVTPSTESAPRIAALVRTGATSDVASSGDSEQKRVAGKHAAVKKHHRHSAAKHAHKHAKKHAKKR